MVQVRKQNNTKRRYAAAALPMLAVLALGGSAVMMSDRAVLQGSPQDAPTVTKSSKAMEQEYDKRAKRWLKHAKNMPICKHVKGVCSEDGLLPRLLASVAAGAKMRSSVMGIGGGPVSFIGLICAAIGILFWERLTKLSSKLMRKGKGAANKEDGLPSTTTTTTNDKASYHSIKNKASDVEDQSSPKVDMDSKDKKSSLYRPETDSTNVTLQDCLESPAVPSVLKRMSDNAMTYLSGTSFTWTKPVTTYKIFIALLLFIELNDLMAPEQTIMYTPEIIALQRAKPDPREYVPYMADYLTPSLSYATADLWYQRLCNVRALLICSWLTYLVLPPKRIGGVAYIVGALLYVYLATIGLMYNLGHSMQGGILFILLSIVAVPFLGCPKYGDRSARWLRRSLYILVLVPIYLFSGVSKFRYKGIWTQITGSWMTSALTKKGMRRSVIPGVFRFIRERQWAMAFFSYGNFVIEYLLPLAMLLWIENPLVQALFHVSCIIFHLSIFALMGPNFIRYCLMHILAWNPFGGFGFKPRASTTEASPTPTTPATWLNKVQAGITYYCLFSWFWVQFISDVQHLQGKVDRMERRNPYFPFPELSMFAKPKHPNYTCAFFLTAIAAGMYLVVLFTRWSLDRDSTETSFWYWMPFTNYFSKQKAYKGTMVVPLGEEEMELARKNGTTFVVYNGGAVPNRRNGQEQVLYMVTPEDDE